MSRYYLLSLQSDLDQINAVDLFNGYKATGPSEVMATLSATYGGLIDTRIVMSEAIGALQTGVIDVIFYSDAEDFKTDARWSATFTYSYDLARNGVISEVDPANLPLFTNGPDIVIGTAEIDIYEGLAGGDWISGKGADDQLYGGRGNDSLQGNSGSDLLKGEAGNDRLSGGRGRDVLQGASGDDVLSGDQGNDTLSGGDGMDLLNGGHGNDKLRGGIKADYFEFKGNFGNDTILDFDVTGADADTLRFHSGNGEAQSFSEFRAAIHKVSGVFVYDLGDDGINTIAFAGLRSADLDVIQFAIV